MDNDKREKVLKTRQKLLDLLKDSKWHLVKEEFKEASDKINEIKKIMDHLIGILVSEEP